MPGQWPTRETLLFNRVVNSVSTCKRLSNFCDFPSSGIFGDAVLLEEDMRILAAFFGVIFMFINPAMVINVRKEVTSAFSTSGNFELKIISVLRKIFIDHLSINSQLEKAAPLIVFVMVLLHLIITCLSLYGIYSCRPAFIRPMLVDASISICILLGFVSLSLYLHTNKMTGDKEMHERNAYVGAAFLLTYFVWLSVTVAGYYDVCRLHADFMYWIVEERQSMRRESPHCVSIENSYRSDRSSKGSKHSTRSARTENIIHEGSRANSTTGSVRSASNMPGKCRVSRTQTANV